jgi:hypothetical protein
MDFDSRKGNMETLDFVSKLYFVKCEYGLGVTFDLVPADNPGEAITKTIRMHNIKEDDNMPTISIQKFDYLLKYWGNKDAPNNLIDFSE